MHLALVVVAVYLQYFNVLSVADVLPVNYSAMVRWGCLCSVEIGFVALRRVAIVQVKIFLCYVVICILFSKCEVSLIYVSFLAVSNLSIKSGESCAVFGQACSSISYSVVPVLFCFFVLFLVRFDFYDVWTVVLVVVSYFLVLQR